MLRVEGGGERVFGETSLPAMGDVAWGPGHRILVDWDAGHLLRIGLDGRSESLGQLPFRHPDCAAVNASAPRRLVCVVPEQISDVWMVARFDPEAGGD